MVYQHALISAAGLVFALVLPRLLIPVAEDFQFVSFTRDGLLRVALAPFILARDANFIYSLVAYALPVLMLASPRQLGLGLSEALPWNRMFLGIYGALVLILSFLGGTDFYRFSSYLLPLMALTLAKLADRYTLSQTLVVLAAVVIFNRIWLPFPNTDLDQYLDFYGASGTRFNLTSVLRIGELTVFLAVGFLMRRVAGPRRWNLRGLSGDDFRSRSRPASIHCGAYRSRASCTLARALLNIHGPVTSNPYDTVRRTVASAALHLAFRRYLGENGILFEVQQPTPFSDPDRYDLRFGGHTCELKPFLISRASQWQQLSGDPRLALAAPALVPLDRHTSETVKARDLYAFAFVGAAGCLEGAEGPGPGSASRRVLDARHASVLAGGPAFGTTRSGRSKSGGSSWHLI